MFPKSMKYLKILGAKRVTQSKDHIRDPQMLGATIQNVVTRDLCTPVTDDYNLNFHGPKSIL